MVTMDNQNDENAAMVASDTVPASVSAQDGIVALGKDHVMLHASLSILPKVGLQTVPMFVWLKTHRSRSRRVQYQPLSSSTPLSFRQPVLYCSGMYCSESASSL